MVKVKCKFIVDIYIVILYSLVRFGRVKVVIILFEKLLLFGVFFSIVIYIILLKVCFKVDELEMVLKFYVGMWRDGFIFLRVIYRMVIRGFYVVGMYDEVDVLLEVFVYFLDVNRGVLYRILRVCKSMISIVSSYYE